MVSCWLSAVPMAEPPAARPRGPTEFRWNSVGPGPLCPARNTHRDPCGRQTETVFLSP